MMSRSTSLRSSSVATYLPDGVEIQSTGLQARWIWARAVVHNPLCGNLCKTCCVLCCWSLPTKGCVSFQTNISPASGQRGVGSLCTHSLLEGLAEELAFSKATCLSPRGDEAVPGLRSSFPEQCHSSPLSPGPPLVFDSRSAGAGHTDRPRWAATGIAVARNEPSDADEGMNGGISPLAGPSAGTGCSGEAPGGRGAQAKPPEP